MDEKQKPTAQLQDWLVQWNPLTGTAMLAGKVAEHPGLPDGAEIVTSALMRLDMEKREAETMNTLYRLGSPFKLSHEEVAARMLGALLGERAQAPEKVN